MQVSNKYFFAINLSKGFPLIKLFKRVTKKTFWQSFKNRAGLDQCMADGKNKSELETILESDPHITIVRTKKRKIPKIDYRRFRKPEEVQKVMDLIIQFINADYYTDDFTGEDEAHQKRTEYLRQLEEQHGAEAFRTYKLNNGLGFTKLQCTAVLLESCINTDYTGPNRQAIQRTLRRLRRVTDYTRCLETKAIYDKQGNDDKIAFLEKIKEIMLDAISAI